MAFSIEWTELAISDLEESVSFIASDDPAAAQAVGNEIIRCVELLKDFPCLGPTYPRRAKTNIHEIVASKRYRVFYRVFEDRDLIEVLRVWHTSKDEPKLA